MQPDEPGHYGKLDHSGKKTPVADPGPSEYGKLDRTQMQPDEPGHYGKLDHSGKKTNTLPVADPGSSEYGKLDRSQMEDPLHYGKLDHPGKRGATLPGGVAPTDLPAMGNWTIPRCRLVAALLEVVTCTTQCPMNLVTKSLPQSRRDSTLAVVRRPLYCSHMCVHQQHTTPL
ncbi:hypothetical protein GBAR_LOCUS10711 [Geodia barretti]|uniref:Uncharacterized protein n=1 Tax=Geodia barretti TaxID=519541 RepID=A0AA35RWA0_GEOBA|nr:hypothetical protein GBAR_LOCUS10711 [Geodia barretti]